MGLKNIKFAVITINSANGMFLCKKTICIAFIPDDLGVLCREYLNLIQKKYGIHSELLFTSADSKKPLQVASINKKFHDFWNKPMFSSNHTKEPTVHSIRHSFVIIRMNKWTEQGIELNGMMPYISKYLGHTSVDDTFYYYHQIESAFKTIRSKDSASTIIIPEVCRDEN